jgi:hypothetical protein
MFNGPILPWCIAEASSPLISNRGRVAQSRFERNLQYAVFAGQEIATPESEPLWLNHLPFCLTSP